MPVHLRDLRVTPMAGDLMGWILAAILWALGAVMAGAIGRNNGHDVREWRNGLVVVLWPASVVAALAERVITVRITWR